MPNLSGYDITDVCYSHFHTEPFFKGVYASDELPPPSELTKSPPCFIIVNTDPSNQPGEHWVTLFIENSTTVTYFCSLGTLPIQPISNFLSFFNKVKMSIDQWQSNESDLCGEFALFFSDLKCQNFDNIQIANLFDNDNMELNDFLVSQYIHGHMTL